jgi:hypothetical protein
VQIHRLEKNLIETELLESDPGTGAQINYVRRSILRRARVYTLACGSVINGEGIDKTDLSEVLCLTALYTDWPLAVRQRK